MGAGKAALGAEDTDWLPRVGRHRWTVIGRDAKIYERPAEMEAYMRAHVQVFLLAPCRNRCPARSAAGTRHNLSPALPTYPDARNAQMRMQQVGRLRVRRVYQK